MREQYNIIKKEAPLNKTVNIREILGKRVLSKGGKIIGKVLEIRLNPKNLELQGILVRGGLIKEKIYIGKSYFSTLSQEAVILNMEVSVLIRDKPVMNSEGKIIGRVKEVVRRGERNDIKGLHVKSLFSQKFFIPSSAIDHVNKSVVLKSSYNARKKYFWQKSK